MNVCPKNVKLSLNLIQFNTIEAFFPFQYLPTWSLVLHWYPDTDIDTLLMIHAYTDNDILNL